MNPHHKILPIALGLLITCSAQAEPEQCKEALVNDLFEAKLDTSSNEAKLALAHAGCLKKEGSQSGGKDTHAEIGYGDFGFSFGNKGNDTASMKEENCSSYSDNKHFDSMVYHASKNYNKALSVWKECMIAKKEEFICWAEKQEGTHSALIHMQWTILSPRPKVIAVGYSGSLSKNRVLVYNKGDRLYLGDNDVTVPVEDNESLQFNAQLTADDTSSKSCTVFIPKKEEPVEHKSPPPPPPPPVIKESTWVSSPSIGAPSQNCTCLSMIFTGALPSVPGMQPVLSAQTTSGVQPAPPAPLGPSNLGTAVIVKNQCTHSLKFEQIKDMVNLSNVPFPTLANGRLFAHDLLQPGETLRSDIGGAFAWVNRVEGCSYVQANTP